MTRQSAVCVDCGGKVATVRGRFCKVHLTERRYRSRKPSAASRAAGKRNSLRSGFVITPPKPVPAVGSWWALPMSREQFDETRQQQQPRMQSNPTYGRMRGGPCINQW